MSRLTIVLGKRNLSFHAREIAYANSFIADGSMDRRAGPLCLLDPDVSNVNFGRDVRSEKCVCAPSTDGA